MESILLQSITFTDKGIEIQRGGGSDPELVTDCCLWKAAVNPDLRFDLLATPWAMLTVSFREGTKKCHLWVELTGRGELFPVFYYLLLGQASFPTCPGLCGICFAIFHNYNRTFVTLVLLVESAALNLLGVWRFIFLYLFRVSASKGGAAGLDYSSKDSSEALEETLHAQGWLPAPYLSPCPPQLPDGEG